MLLLIVAALLSLAQPAVAGPSPEASTRKPNVLLIMVVAEMQRRLRSVRRQ